MPSLLIDTEQAALIKVAVTMLAAALVARTERVDPEQVISKALQLQAYKLETVLKLLDMPEPAEFSELSKALRAYADKQLWLLHTKADDAAKDAAWRRLREVFIAPAFPTDTQA